jgi:hypothetical protein
MSVFSPDSLITQRFRMCRNLNGRTSFISSQRIRFCPRHSSGGMKAATLPHPCAQDAETAQLGRTGAANISEGCSSESQAARDRLGYFVGLFGKGDPNQSANYFREFVLAGVSTRNGSRTFSTVKLRLDSRSAKLRKGLLEGLMVRRERTK